MILIKKVTLKNFLSIGNVPQSINYDSGQLTLIVGENCDVGNNSSNGSGKTSLLNALSYGLFGSPIASIKLDNLVNRTNEKNMSVTVEFSVNGVDYRVERSRKPTTLKLYVDNDQCEAVDEANGDSRNTQERIESILGMSHTMFQHIVGLNSTTTPFLSMRASEQREVIEQLLGITILSERADKLRELNKETRDAISKEEYRIHGIEESNKRMTSQIDSLVIRQAAWKKNQEKIINETSEKLEKLLLIDPEAEIASQELLEEYNMRADQYSRYIKSLNDSMNWSVEHEASIKLLMEKLHNLENLDFDNELAIHESHNKWAEEKKKYEASKIELTKLKKQHTTLENNKIKLLQEIEQLMNHKCYACGSEIHDVNQAAILRSKSGSLDEVSRELSECKSAIADLQNLQCPEKPSKNPQHSTLAELYAAKNEIDSINKELSSRQEMTNPFTVLDVVEHPGAKPVTVFGSMKEAMEHSSKITEYGSLLLRVADEVDPYSDQIAEMKNSAMVTVDYTTINELNSKLQHGEFLLDLLTNKKSFVRKRIISSNLSHLNSRLAYYLSELGLPHQVVFQDDLSVEITELNRDADFDSCSRGERNRIVLALSFAFRDVWESLYSPCNLLFVDELIDTGMDATGVEAGLHILKKMVRERNKSVWLVSHRDELRTRCDKMLAVRKTNGFSELLEQTE
jgi:DNA repair exonuclease SbcCD ATPase subunit